MTPSELRANVGQLIIMGFVPAEMTSALRVVLRAIRPGGVILFARNITGAEQTWTLLRECREAAAAPASGAAKPDARIFLCVDLEGGTVDRLKELIAPAPSVSEVSTTGNPKIFRQHGRIIGDEVRALGFNTDFAPVLDLEFDAAKKVLTTRTASPDPLKVVTYAREFLRGLREARVLGCGKHFPGLGEARLDTHKQLPSIDKSWHALWREDLVPYRELRKELPFVMVAHANYPAVTRDQLPASLSPKWMNILRDKIGYKGLVVSDDLEMGGVLAAASIGDAAVETLRAGADMFLVCHNEEQVWRAYETVLREAERDKKFAKVVAKRAARVRDAKKRARELQGELKAPTARQVTRLRDAMEQFRQQLQQAEAHRL